MCCDTKIQCVLSNLISPIFSLPPCVCFFFSLFLWIPVQRNMSDTIWHSLRSTLFMAKQPELVSLVTDKQLEPFHQHFDF